MASVKIIKGRIRNIVDEAMFEKLYKPNGWVLDNVGIQETNSENDIPESINTQSELSNYKKMKSKTTRKFNDKLFFSDERLNNE